MIFLRSPSKSVDLGPKNGRVSLTLRDRIDQTVNFTVKLAEPSLEPQTLAIRLGGEPFAFGVVSSNVFGDDFGAGGVRRSVH